MRKPSKKSVNPTADTIAIPYRFDEAMDLAASLFQRGADKGIPRQTLLAAAMTDLVPRLVSLYGAAGVAAILIKLADQVSMDDGRPTLTQ